MQIFNKIDLAHIGRHMGYSALGAICTLLLSTIIPNLNLSPTTALFIPFITGLIVIVQTYATKKDQDLESSETTSTTA